MITEERIDYLEAYVLGTKEALELFTYYRNILLETSYLPSSEDPHNERAKIAFMSVQTYQYLITRNQQITEGEKNERTSGEPTT